MMLTLSALYVLATCDAAFCGFRAAAGRDARLRKRRYYARAMIVGALWGLACIAIVGMTAWLVATAHSDPEAIYSKYAVAGQRLLQIYLPYAGIIGFAFVVRTIPSVDIRSMTSVLVFGPLTLLRPVVAVAGIAWACIPEMPIEVVVVGLVALPLMLFLEGFLCKPYEPSAYAKR